MMKNLFKISIPFLFLLLVLVTANNSSFAQTSGKIVSGEYESLLLGVDSDGNLTGYFFEATGNDEMERPRFTCSFFISGEKQTDGNYKIKTWFPGDVDEVIGGEIKFVGKKSVNLKLDGEHGGCWNVAPMLKEDEGVDFDLTAAGNWESIRVVSASKGYFYHSAEAKAPQKIWVVQNDVVRVSQTKGDKAGVTFVSDSGRKKSGWINTRDFYDVSAPPSNN
jgi:hypothetical protein